MLSNLTDRSSSYSYIIKQAEWGYNLVKLHIFNKGWEKQMRKFIRQDILNTDRKFRKIYQAQWNQNKLIKNYDFHIFYSSIHFSN